MSALLPTQQWPQRLPTHDVQMQMRDLLPGVVTDVRQHTVAAVRDPFCCGHFADDRKHVGQTLSVHNSHSGGALMMILRHDQYVGRSGWLGVSEGHHRVALVDDLSWNLADGNLAENAITHGGSVRSVAPDPRHARQKRLQRARAPVSRLPGRVPGNPRPRSRLGI